MDSQFDCNICLELAKNVVVTRCGHLYCWKCLYNWMNTKAGNFCPVCKGAVVKETLTPIYGPCEFFDEPDGVPPRPVPRSNRVVIPGVCTYLFLFYKLVRMVRHSTN